MGSVDDLDAVQVSDVETFFKLHYAPNHATVALVGDFDPDEARRLIQAYFGDIPRGAPASRVQCSANFAAGERIQSWPDPLASLPAVIITYRIPAHNDPDFRALQLLALIAGQGEESRLKGALVRNAHVAVQSASGVESRDGPGLLYVYAILNQGVNPDSAKKLLGAQVARLSRDPTPVELTRATTQHRATSVFGRQTTALMAEGVVHFARYHSGAEDINTELGRCAPGSIADFRGAAATNLVPPNSA